MVPGFLKAFRLDLKKWKESESVRVGERKGNSRQRAQNEQRHRGRESRGLWRGQWKKNVLVLSFIVLGAAGARELKRMGVRGEIGSVVQGPVAQVTQIAIGR